MVEDFHLLLSAVKQAGLRCGDVQEIKQKRLLYLIPQMPIALHTGKGLFPQGIEKIRVKGGGIIYLRGLSDPSDVFRGVIRKIRPDPEGYHVPALFQARFERNDASPGHGSRYITFPGGAT